MDKKEIKSKRQLTAVTKAFERKLKKELEWNSNITVDIKFYENYSDICVDDGSVYMTQVSVNGIISVYQEYLKRYSDIDLGIGVKHIPYNGTVTTIPSVEIRIDMK